MVLGTFQCRGVHQLWTKVGQGPTVFAVGAGAAVWVFIIVPL